MSLQPIYEAKAKRILTEIGDINKVSNVQINYKTNSNHLLCFIQTDIQSVQQKFSELLSIARLITNMEFLLQLRYTEMPNRNIMKQFLEFLTQHVKFDVSF